MKYIKDFPKKLPDFRFLDLNMPEMNGKNCFLNIRQLPRLKNVPVITYSISIDSSRIKFLCKKWSKSLFKNLKSAILNCLETINTSSFGIVHKSIFIIQS
tara:strand:- start:11030 stop:11329 length:300 start_codon:yes stop_codon:yes gene_type:complete